MILAIALLPAQEVQEVLQELLQEVLQEGPQLNTAESVKNIVRSPVRADQRELRHIMQVGNGIFWLLELLTGSAGKCSLA